MISLEVIAQIAIAILGILAITLVAQKNKWGFVVGLCAQPFWIYTSFTHKQWGVFILSILYIFSWLYGIYEWFFKDKKEDKK